MQAQDVKKRLAMELVEAKAQMVAEKGKRETVERELEDKERERRELEVIIVGSDRTETPAKRTRGTPGGESERVLEELRVREREGEVRIVGRVCGWR